MGRTDCRNIYVLETWVLSRFNSAKQKCNENEEEIFKLRTENNRLEALVKTLRRELEESRTAHNKTRLVTNNDESKVNELKLDIIQTKQELSRAKEALQGE